MFDLLLKMHFPLIFLLQFLQSLLFCILQSIGKYTSIVILNTSALKCILKLAQPLLFSFTYCFKIFLLVMPQFRPIPFASHLLVGLHPLFLLLFHHSYLFFASLTHYLKAVLSWLHFLHKFLTLHFELLFFQSFLFFFGPFLFCFFEAHHSLMFQSLSLLSCLFLVYTLHFLLDLLRLFVQRSLQLLLPLEGNRQVLLPLWILMSGGPASAERQVILDHAVLLPGYFALLPEHFIEGIDCLSLLEKYLCLINHYFLLLVWDWLGKDGELCFGLADLGDSYFYLLHQLALDKATVFLIDLFQFLLFVFFGQEVALVRT